MEDDYFVVKDELYEQALASERQYRIGLPQPERSIREAADILAQYHFDQAAGESSRGPVRWMTFWANRAQTEEALTRWALM